MNLFDAFGSDIQAIVAFLDGYYSLSKRDRYAALRNVGIASQNPLAGLSADQITKILAGKGITTISEMDKLWNTAISGALKQDKVIRRVVTSHLVGRSHFAYDSLDELLESIKISRLQQSEILATVFRKSCHERLRNSGVFNINPAWKGAVHAFLNRLCPKKRKQKWTKERLNQEISETNAAGMGLSQIRKTNPSLFAYLIRTSRLHPLLASPHESVKAKMSKSKMDKTNPRMYFLKKYKYPQNVARVLKLSSPTYKDEKYGLLYRLLDQTLHQDATFLMCDNDMFLKVAAYLQISSWQDCVTNFPVLAETLARRGLGHNTARLLWPEAPEASGDWMRDDYVPYHQRGVVKKAD